MASKFKRFFKKSRTADQSQETGPGSATQQATEPLIVVDILRHGTSLRVRQGDRVFTVFNAAACSGSISTIGLGDEVQISRKVGSHLYVEKAYGSTNAAAAIQPLRIESNPRMKKLAAK